MKIDEDEMPHVRVRNSRGKLDEWIREVVSKNLLYEMHDIGEMNDDEVIGEVVDDDAEDPEELPLDPAEEEDEGESSDDEDVPLSTLVKYQTDKWCSKNKPRKGENKEEYRARVKKMIAFGNGLKETLTAGATLSGMAVDVVAGKVHDEEAGTKSKKPTKILGKKDEDGSVQYLCLWKGKKGYKQDDKEEWVAEKDARVWSDLVVNYEKVYKPALRPNLTQI